MPGAAAAADAVDALAAAASAGPFFSVDRWIDGVGWLRASVLISDPAVLADRVTHARAVIACRAGVAPAEVTERAAASIVFLGLAARLVSSSLGAAVLGGVIPYLTPDNLPSGLASRVSVHAVRRRELDNSRRSAEERRRRVFQLGR